eukprot:5741189-Prymnesium_polylepis.2
MFVEVELLGRGGGDGVDFSSGGSLAHAALRSVDEEETEELAEEAVIPSAWEALRLRLVCTPREGLLVQLFLLRDWRRLPASNAPLKAASEYIPPGSTRVRRERRDVLEEARIDRPGFSLLHGTC